MGLGIDLPEDVAFFMAQEIQSNVRELEGALRRVIASSEFRGRAITRGLPKPLETLLLQEREW